MFETVKNVEELKQLFDFVSEVFYDDSKEHNEYYYPMGDRYEEMKEQFKKDKDFLIYIKDNNKIVAGIIGKNQKEDKITISLLAVDKKYRNKNLGTKLIEEFEKRCKKKNIRYIDLGARPRACLFYQKLNFKPSLIVQVYDFVKLDDIRKENIYNLKEKKSYFSDTYGFIMYDVNKIEKKYIKHFEENVKTASIQYIFEKELF